MGRKIILGACWVIVSGLFIKLPAQQYSIRKYTAVDGLPQSEVRAMVEDKNGYLWIATQGGGLACFDGREFKVYTTLDGLLSNVISTLFIDTKGKIWMAHPRGITVFDGRQFKKFIQPSTPSARRIRRFYELGDSVFFTSHPGVLGKICHDSVHYWTKSLKPGKSIFFTHSRPGKFVVHYLNDSSFYFNTGAAWTTVSHKGVFNQARSIFSYGSDLGLFTDKGYFKLEFASLKLKPIDVFAQNHIVLYDSVNNNFWTRQDNKLFKEELVNGKPQATLIYEGAEISQLLQDGEGNTWIGSQGDGLIRCFYQDFDRCGSDKLRMVMSIEGDTANGMWIGTATGGLWYMKRGKITTHTLPYGSEDAVLGIKVDGAQNVFAATRSGLGYMAANAKSFTWLNRSNGLSSSFISSLETDSEGGVWVGTAQGGLNYLKDGKISLIADEVSLKTKSIASLKFIKHTGSLFIGTDYGLFEHRPNGDVKPIRLLEFENTSIYSLSSYQDSLLLIGSGGAGFALLHAKTKRYKVFTTKEGLNSGFVFFVASDAQNQIWVGTVNGINRIRINRKWEIVENMHYGFDNGLTGIETNQNAYYFGANMRYFGLIDGLYQFNDYMGDRFKSFPLHFTGVQVLFDQINTSEFATGEAGFFKIPTGLTLPHQHNHLTFYFNKVDKRNPKSVQYKYILENFDIAWSQPSTMGKVTYGSLPPGRYNLKVLATDKNGSWDNQPLVYSFVIETPFYQTASFGLAVGLMVIGAILFGVMYRVRSRVAKVMEVERIRQREQENLRKEIARDFHDEMGNQLTRIINYVSLLRLSAQTHGTGLNGYGELFTKVEASAKYLYSGTRDFIWAIDPVNDELSHLFIHLRDFGVKLFEEKNINFRAFNQLQGTLRLPYGFSRDANLIFKEAMTNTFKHSEASNVTLTAGSSGTDYFLELKDDGKGFNVEEIRTNGLKNIKSRAARIKSKLDVAASPNGTIVTLTFSLSKKPKQHVTK